uniref:Uncharacterized protein n=1 Tax=Mola mola TaxID=94237 RepID=A0A3Q3X904_MOLML
MSTVSCLLTEDQFLCSICLDVFTDPVATPCGHNFCKTCITEHWNINVLCRCPNCKEVFNTRPDLKVNTFISEMTAQFRRLRRQVELIDSIREKQRKLEKQAEGFIKELEQEICELKKRSSEVGQLSQSEDHLHLLQRFLSVNATPQNRNWTGVSICPVSYEGTVMRAVNQVEETLSEQKKKLLEAKLRRVQQYAVDVTLDPDTAHPELILSDDGQQVKHGDVKQNLPDNPERFDTCVCVLAKKSFSSGRFYYEVQVKGKTKWDLGVAREYRACAVPPVRLSLKSRPEKVGVCVDYEEGLVSFYDVDAAALIYSFTGCCFTEKLYPYFCPCHKDGGKNSAPLIISPVNHTE